MATQSAFRRLLLLGLTLMACWLGVAEGANPGTKNRLRWPDPGTTNNPLDVNAVVEAWKFVQHQFYTGSTPPGWVQPSWNADEPKQCLQACPDYYSDIVCHYYCWHPSYTEVVPNVRGCFSQIARGLVKKMDDISKTEREMFYPEIHDFCTYQPYDIVLNPKIKLPDPSNPGDFPRGQVGEFLNQPLVYDQAVIDTNKAAGITPGVMGNLNLRAGEEVFKYIMFTWYDPFLFKSEDQQRAINAFYGAKNPADKKECMLKRPLMAGDPGIHGERCAFAQMTPLPLFWVEFGG